MVLLLLCALGSMAQPPKYEVRAAWVTAVYGLDWPRTRATTQEGIKKQKAETRTRQFTLLHLLWKWTRI